ncbi:MAG: hypothetical protein KDB80_01445, partial [Planctomycetes bacterium]|nr:hypothetical protein [Planctomycetota bacterium]
GPRSETDGVLRVDYHVAVEVLTTFWSRRGQTWFMTRIDLPTPEFDDVQERFLDAWKRSDPTAIASFYSVENRTNVVETLTRSMGQLGWDRLPPVVESLVEGEGDTRAVTLATERGDVKTRWQVRNDGRWGLTLLDLPNR